MTQALYAHMNNKTIKKKNILKKKKKRQKNPQKNPSQKRAGGVAQGVDSGSYPSTAKTNKQTKRCDIFRNLHS
jgi:hypothetical protein